MYFALIGRRKPVLGLRGFQRGRDVAIAEWAVGPERVDRGEVATSTDIGLAGPGRRQGGPTRHRV